MLKKSKTAIVSITLIAALMLLLSGCGSAKEQDKQTGSWKPTKNVEIVAGASPGGGFDLTARTIQRIIQSQGLVDGTQSVINKPGGGGAVGWSYLNEHQADGHYLSISSPNLLTNSITGSNSLSYTDLTPIAHLFNEYIVFMVKADSGIKDGKDLIDKMKADPKSVTIAIATALGNHNHIATGQVMKAAGVDVSKLKTVVFQSAAEATTALLGGKVDLVPTPASNSLKMVEAGKVRVIAVSSPKRLGGPLKDVPTWKELGIDAVFSNWRGVVGPKGMTKEQIAYYNQVFSKVTSSPEWQKDLDKYLWENGYLNSEDTAKYLSKQHEELKPLLMDLGLAKK